MNKNDGKTEQLWVDSNILSRFKHICHIQEKRPKAIVESLMRAYNIEHDGVLKRYLDKKIDTPAFYTSGKNANEMMYTIMAYEPKGFNGTVNDAIVDMYQNYELSNQERMAIKRLLAPHGIGFGKNEEMYIVINHKVIGNIVGSRVYQKELRKHEDYKGSKSCNLAGQTMYCLVFNVGMKYEE
jgi:hypothetical protein